jgi:hypothetical protein
MHVVQVRKTPRGSERHSDQPAFFVRVNRIVALTPEAAQHLEREKHVKRDLGE